MLTTIIYINLWMQQNISFTKIYSKLLLLEHMGPTLGQLHICVFYFLMVHIVYHVYCVPVKF